jgi:lysozyme
MTREGANALLAAANVAGNGPALIGRRGYYRDTMGKPGVNDRGIYDDAIAVISPRTFRTFNANTDPSRYHPGIATLAVGVWRYRKGIHNQSKDPVLHPHYPALVQAAPVTVIRDGGKGPTRESGWFGINIHHGGVNTTSSEGCQTICPDQWEEFIGLVTMELEHFRLDWIPYVLTQREDVR